MQLESLRVIPLNRFSGTLNMALDQVLLEGEGVALRFYQWTQPTLSLGFSQKQPKGLNLEQLAHKGIPLVQRATGGQAVLHHLELTYSLVGDASLFPASVAEAYRVLSAPLELALQSLGVSAQMEPNPRKPKRTSNCFLEVSNFEIAVKGKKLVGSAQVRQGRRLLQHGSILLAIEDALWDGIWNEGEEFGAMRSRFTCLTDELGQAPQVGDLTHRIAGAYQQQWGVDLEVRDFSEAEMKKAQEIEERFRWA